MRKDNFLKNIDEPIKRETESKMRIYGNKYDTKMQMSTFILGILSAMRILDEELWVSISFDELMDFCVKYIDNEE